MTSRFDWRHAPWMISAGLAAFAVNHKGSSGHMQIAVAALVAAVALAMWLSSLRRYQTIIDMPPSRIASAAQGYVELHGRGAALEGVQVLSPLTGLPLLWYRFSVERRNYKNEWQHESTETSDASFLIDDGSGRCCIDPKGAKMVVTHTDVELEGDTRSTLWYLLPGTMIHVLGDMKTMGGAAEQESESDIARDLLADWKKDRATLLKRFDLNGDGQIDEREWQLARAEARREAARAYAEAAAAPEINLVGRPADGRPFMISDLDPAHMARSYYWWAWIYLGLFFAALAAGIYSWQH